MEITEELKQEIYQNLKAGNTFRATAKEYDIRINELLKIFHELSRIESNNNPLPSLPFNNQSRNDEIFRKILAGKTPEQLGREYELNPSGIYNIFRKLGGEKEQINTPRKIREKEINKMIKSGKSPEEIAIKFNLFTQYIKQKYFKQKNKKSNK